jgi:hypothetical protein
MNGPLLQYASKAYIQHMLRKLSPLPGIAVCIFLVSALLIVTPDFLCKNHYGFCPYDPLEGIGLMGIIAAFGLFSIWLILRLHQTTHHKIAAPLNVLLIWIFTGTLLSFFMNEGWVYVYVITFHLLSVWALWAFIIGCLCISKKQNIVLGILYLALSIPILGLRMYLFMNFGNWGMAFVPVG